MIASFSKTPLSMFKKWCRPSDFGVDIKKKMKNADNFFNSGPMSPIFHIFSNTNKCNVLPHQEVLTPPHTKNT